MCVSGAPSIHCYLSVPPKSTPHPLRKPNSIEQVRRGDTGTAGDLLIVVSVLPSRYVSDGNSVVLGILQELGI